MNESLNFSKKNKGTKKSIFDSHQILDWYDGAILGFGIERNTNCIFLYGLMAHDYESRLRIFALIIINENIRDKLNVIIEKKQSRIFKKMLQDIYLDLSPNSLYLMKAYAIDDTDYEIIQIKPDIIQYFSGAEAIYNQSKKATKRWFDFFQ